MANNDMVDNGGLTGSQIAMGLLSGGLSLIPSIFNAVSQKKVNKQNIDFQKEVNANNLAFEREKFEYDKFMNANKFQVQSNDMLKAGINPIAQVGANFNSFTGSAGQVASQSQAPQLDSSALMGVMSDIVNLKIAKMNNDTQKEVAHIQAESNEKISNSSNETQKSIANIQKEIAEANNVTQKEIAEANNETQKSIAELNNRTQKEIADARNKLDQNLTRLIERNKLVLQQHEHDFQTGDELADFKKDLMKFEEQLNETLQKNQEMRNAIKLPGKYFANNQSQLVTLGQADAIMKSYLNLWNTDDIQRLIQNMTNIIGAFGSVLGPASAAAHR